MTKEEMESQRPGFEKRFGNMFNCRLESSIFPDELVYADINTQLVFAGWIAAKQDSEQQRKELQERLNHDPKY